MDLNHYLVLKIIFFFRDLIDQCPQAKNKFKPLYPTVNIFTTFSDIKELCTFYHKTYLCFPYGSQKYFDNFPT